jgi:hypothetical protein
MERSECYPALYAVWWTEYLNVHLLRGWVALMRITRWVVLAAVAAVVAWIVLLPGDWRAWAGFSSQATDQYAFVSGVGPMLLTALLGSSVVAGLWHGLNCHREGCYRIGRHKVSGTPWCNRHHEGARPAVTVEDKLDELLDLLRAQAHR